MRFKKPDSVRWIHFFGSMERYKDLVPFFAFTHSRIHAFTISCMYYQPPMTNKLKVNTYFMVST
jgi:hypothetical protein